VAALAGTGDALDGDEPGNRRERVKRDVLGREPPTACPAGGGSGRFAGGRARGFRRDKPASNSVASAGGAVWRQRCGGPGGRFASSRASGACVNAGISGEASCARLSAAP